MPVITGDIAIWVTHYLLFVVRMSALFILSPIFGRNNIPNSVKILMSVVMSIIAVQFYPPPAELHPTLLHFILAIAGELLVGLSLGYITSMFFAIVFTAGHIIDTQIGFGMVQIYDIQTNAQIPVAGSLLNLVMLESFILVNGHLKLIEILFDTFEYIPVGNVQLNAELGTFMLKGFLQTFVLSLNVAMPIIASGLVAEIGLGIVVRTAPQMNIFVLGMPLKVILGLILLSVMTPVFVSFTNTIFERMFILINEMFQYLAPGGG